MNTDRSTNKKLGRRKAGTWGRTYGPRRGNTKRAANKAVRRAEKLTIGPLILGGSAYYKRRP